MNLQKYNHANFPKEQLDLSKALMYPLQNWGFLLTQIKSL